MLSQGFFSAGKQMLGLGVLKSYLVAIYCWKEAMVIRGRQKLLDLVRGSIQGSKHLRKELLLEVQQTRAQLRLVNKKMI